MPTVFISYSRESHDLVRSIAEDLQALGYQTWFDQALTGGQAWWDLILEEIQKCDVFAFALEPESFSSAACKREYTYAARLGKSILPVLVADGVPTDLLPEALAQIQFVDYRRGDRKPFESQKRPLDPIRLRDLGLTPELLRLLSDLSTSYFSVLKGLNPRFK